MTVRAGIAPGRYEILVLVRREGPLGWRHRHVYRYVRRDVRLVDGAMVGLWGFPRGIRPSSSWSFGVGPWEASAFQVAFQNLRYRTAYRGQWVVEIRNPESDLPIDERIVASRSTAMTTIEEVQDALPTLTLNHVGLALRT